MPNVVECDLFAEGQTRGQKDLAPGITLRGQRKFETNPPPAGEPKYCRVRAALEGKPPSQVAAIVGFCSGCGDNGASIDCHVT